MSTEIKPGQVWAKDDDHDYEVKVVWASSDSVHYERPTVGESRAQVKAFLYEFHLVKDVDTTPAPLDPSKVKAGDTVTVEVSNSKPDVPTYTVEGEVHNDNQGRPWVGPILLNSKYPGMPVSITLTDHKPAPKPEWKPGTTGTATVRTIPNIRVMRLDGVTKPWVSATFFAPAGDVKGEGQNRHDDWQVTDFVPDELRPLPTREQVKAALEPGWARDSMIAMVDAVVALLRGES